MQKLLNILSAIALKIGAHGERRVMERCRMKAFRPWPKGVSQGIIVYTLSVIQLILYPTGFSLIR